MEQNNNLSIKTLQPTFITVDEMAKLLSIARVTAYQLTKTKNFPCFHIGKRIIIPLHAFNEWVEKQAESKSTILELR